MLKATRLSIWKMNTLEPTRMVPTTLCSLQLQHVHHHPAIEVISFLPFQRPRRQCRRLKGTTITTKSRLSSHHSSSSSKLQDSQQRMLLLVMCQAFNPHQRQQRILLPAMCQAFNPPQRQQRRQRGNRLETPLGDQQMRQQ